MTGELLWFISRSAGLVALVLLTSVMVLGMLTAARTVHGRAGGAAAVVAGVHRTLALGAIVFLAVHVITAVVDDYVDIGWIAAVAPFASGYERVWVGLGTMALDIAITVVVVSLVRHRISERWWRGIHFLTYAAFAFAVIHGLAMAASGLTVAACVVSGGVFGGALIHRLVHRDRDRQARAGYPGLLELRPPHRSAEDTGRTRRAADVTRRTAERTPT
ncbi:ferric reductase-like transmembrane domain-containing protein [Brevibacterium daeguense]|uniref:Ferric reductase-like transmembrane domain-containing protein n=1 Tax=Brevibacterium daeguense TaxID=909936 RepID=A0ABP8EGD4_9MICO|nr:ferric reductase-like transmembrane domain-containing protein [Brevibacterium daeguense]